jgi:lipid II:glycine glycyltransferase (peptidoglycan interpeptide bridge formation enzyme)
VSENVHVRQGIPGEDWDELLRHLSGHFLQSRAWMSFQHALGNSVVSANGDGWMWSGTLQQAGPFRYLYTPYGPTAQTPQKLVTAIANLRSAGAQLHCDFVRVEPDHEPGALPPSTRAVRPRQPRATWLLGLEPGEAELRRGLTKGHKGSINSAPRKGISCHRDDAGIDEFLRLLHCTEKHSQIATHSDEYFRTLASALDPTHLSIYFAAKDGDNIATAMAFHFNSTTYYAHAGADPQYRNLSASAPLLWQMISDAKQRGDRVFDFWGVTTSTDPKHPWAGFTQFKRSFGGELHERAGTFDIPIRRGRYAAFSLLHRLVRG